VLETPQSENTPFNPQSPYAVSKLYAYWITKNYREAYNIFACNGILFNHESPRRGLSFVTRKITTTVAKIHHRKQEKLYLGNLDAKRDWGYAKDYIEAMWLVLQQDQPKDYVIATGENHTVREFVEKAFTYINIDITWAGKGINEKGMNSKTGRVLVEIDPYYFRPTEVNELLGSPLLAKKDLNWRPKVSFNNLIKIMMEADLEMLK